MSLGTPVLAGTNYQDDGKEYVEEVDCGDGLDDKCCKGNTIVEVSLANPESLLGVTRSFHVVTVDLGFFFCYTF